MQQDQLRYDRRRYARGPGLPRPFLTVEDEEGVPKSHSYVVSRVLSRHNEHILACIDEIGGYNH